MDGDGPMFNPGDQKVTGQGFPAATSSTANRAYFVLALGLALLGIGCLFLAEHVAGVVMIVVGSGAAGLFARAELRERAMLRRRRKAAGRGSPPATPPP